MSYLAVHPFEKSTAGAVINLMLLGYAYPPVGDQGKPT